MGLTHPCDRMVSRETKLVRNAWRRGLLTGPQDLGQVADDLGLSRDRVMVSAGLPTYEVVHVPVQVLCRVSVWANFIYNNRLYVLNMAS